MQPDETNPLLRYRKPRIAWSVFWGLACVLLIVLWVRSYWRRDIVEHINENNTSIAISSHRGALDLYRTIPGDLLPPVNPHWHHGSDPSVDPTESPRLFDWDLFTPSITIPHAAFV